jgi:L-rhamnose mutarotase
LIFRCGEILFSYLEYTGTDPEADNAAIAADEATREWWTVCEPLQRPLADRAPGEWWKAIPEVFHLD